MVFDQILKEQDFRKPNPDYTAEIGLHGKDIESGIVYDFNTVQEAAEWAFDDYSDCPKHSEAKAFTSAICKNILDGACGMEDREDKTAPRGTAYGCEWEIDSPEAMSDKRFELYMQYHGQLSSEEAADYVKAQREDEEAEKRRIEDEKRAEARARRAAERARIEAEEKAEAERMAPILAARKAEEEKEAKRKELFDQLKARTEAPDISYVEKHRNAVLKALDRYVRDITGRESVKEYFGCEPRYGWPRRGVDIDFILALHSLDRALQKAADEGRYKGEVFSYVDYFDHLKKVKQTLLGESLAKKSSNSLKETFEDDFDAFEDEDTRPYNDDCFEDNDENESTDDICCSCCGAIIEDWSDAFMDDDGSIRCATCMTDDFYPCDNDE